MRYLFEDKKFYKTLVTLAMPIAAQNLVSASVNTVDTIMIGSLGETQIAAVGLANQLFFLFTLMLFGINSGSAIFTAQFWGKRDIKNIRRVLGICLSTASAAAVLFTVLAMIFPKQVMNIYTNDPAVIDLGSRYLRIVGISYLITAVSFSYASILRSTEQPKVPMVMSIISVITNTVFNYLMIFGKFGFPEMGVEGAAIATVIARVVEVGLMLIFVYAGKYVPAARLHEMFDLSGEFIKRFYKTTIPVILNESLWSLGVSIYSVIYGHISTNAVAAVNISGTIERVAMVLFHGISNASAIMIGNRIGAGEEDKAYIYAKRFLTLGPLFAVAAGGILLLLNGSVMHLFNVSEAVKLDARRVLAIFSCVMPAKIFNLINIVGVLRSGGDTKYSLFLDTVGVWFIAIPLAFVGGILLHFPVHWVVMLVLSEEIFKMTLGIKRFLSKKWINNLVHHISDEPVEIAEASAAL